MKAYTNTYEPYEGPTYTPLSHTEPVAKKDYICDVCQKPIVQGAKYYRHVYKEDDVIVTYRKHISGECMSEEYQELMEVCPVCGQEEAGCTCDKYLQDSDDQLNAPDFDQWREQ